MTCTSRFEDSTATFTLDPIQSTRGLVVGSSPYHALASASSILFLFVYVFFPTSNFDLQGYLHLTT
jgi:hypothetical protein